MRRSHLRSGSLLTRGLRSPARRPSNGPRANPGHWPLTPEMRDFVDSLGESRKIVMLTTPLDLDRLARELRALDGKQETHAKPLGFWYACGGGWIEYAASDVPSKFGPWIYELDLDLSRVLALHTQGSVLRFTESVGAKGGDVIRWGAVAHAFDGVEARPYFSALRYDDRVGWYAGWDVPSGCLWSMDVLRGVRLLRGPATGHRRAGVVAVGEVPAHAITLRGGTARAARPPRARRG